MTAGVVDGGAVKVGVADGVEVNVGVVNVIVPEGIDDLRRPSGGNIYDRRLCLGLSALGWSVHEWAVPGSWPFPDGEAHSALARLLADLGDQAVVLVDGLIATASRVTLARQIRRLRVVVLMHMPLAGSPGVGRHMAEAEAEVLRSAGAVITTSGWTRDLLLDRYQLPPNLLHVARPGVDLADPAPGSVGGGNLLCVAAVAPHKGHDVLLAALTDVADLDWQCTCVGATDGDAGFAGTLGVAARSAGIGSRFRLAGPMSGAALDGAYATGDVLLLASRGETFGMVVVEALSRGMPVIATAVGGVPEALGVAPDGSRPGLLVPDGDTGALSAAVRRWLCDADLRAELRRSARARSLLLPRWSETAEVVSTVLAGVGC